MNVLFYVLDCLRKDHLSVYGYPRETAPNLSKLAQEGVVFEKAFSQGAWTRPSAGSILTGCYPAVHGAVTMRDSVSDKVPSLPGLLQHAGYKTAGFSTIVQVSSYFGFNRGFDSYIDLFKERKISEKRYCYFLGKQKGNIQRDIFPSSEDINQYFLPWLREHVGNNFFAFLWSMDTHVPYLQGKDGSFFNPNYKGLFDGSKASIKKIKTQEGFSQFINCYDSEIYYTDYRLGKIINELKRLGIYEETMIVVLADHGECFNDHSRIGESFIADTLKRHKLFRKNNYKIRLHGSIFPYDELINVPLIIKFSYGAFAGQRVDALVQLIDLVPTVLDILKVPDKLWTKEVQGRSLLPVVRGDARKINPFVFSHSHVFPHTSCYYSVRDQGYKLILTVPPKFTWHNFVKRPKHLLFSKLLSKRKVLFDSRSGEKVNLLYKKKKEADQLLNVLVEWIGLNEEQRCGLSDAQTIVDNDEMVMEQLKGLGYLD